MSLRQVLGVDFDKLFASIDKMDTESFVGFLTEDCTFRFGSAPAVSGHEAIAAAVGGFFQSIAGLSHDIQRVIAGDDSIAVEGNVTYTRHDGSQVTLPFCNIFEAESGLISVYRIYIDIAPLFAGN